MMTNKTISHHTMSTFIVKQQFPSDSKWPSLLLCLHSQQYNENLSSQQHAEISELLVKSLGMSSFSDQLFEEVFQKKEAIINAQYLSELQGALEETATILDQFETISKKRVGDIVNLEKTTLSTVSSGESPRDMVAKLRKAFKTVVKVMEEDSKILEELSNTDQLTRLANRRFFDKFLQQSIKTGSNKEPLALLMLDIDNFKNFNDNYGHLVGDEVLRIVAKILKESASERNIHGNKKYLSARYGGEEFSVIMPQSTEQQCLQLAECIRKRIEHYPIIIRNSKGDILKKDIHITVSIGFCQMHHLWPQVQTQTDQIIAAADKALYEAKRRGKNMVCQAKTYLDHNKKITLAIL